ncbi:MAG TPA: hypothetical protein VH437_16915 [Terriglobales bacterium]
MTMPRTSAILVLLLLIFATLLSAKKEETLEELVARAEAAKIESQPDLFIEAAERQLAAAGDAFTAGNSEQGLKAVQDIVTYSDKAGTAADKSGKKLKHTEIALRKMAAKLRDIKRTVEFENQAPIQDAADHLEQLRSNLLNRMFGKEAK